MMRVDRTLVRIILAVTLVSCAMANAVSAGPFGGKRYIIQMSSSQVSSGYANSLRPEAKNARSHAIGRHLRDLV